MSKTNLNPRHVAIIMDGNGRWARNRGMRRIAGHIAGMKSVRAIVEAACEMNVTHLSLYAFSLQNWGRPKDEVRGLMELLAQYLEKETATLVKNGIRLNPIGRLDRLPAGMRAALEETVKKTRGGKNLTLTLAISYGAREEIVEAVKKIAAAGTKPERITKKTVAANLHTAGLPEPDLLIRTGGEMRLSNFFLWQSAYTEIYVAKTLWPDFRRRHLKKAVETYMSRERRFGLTEPALGTQKKRRES
ncbi:MAG: di-trans,poly-cis-decaprenylcistransferase [Candidatus Mycalebacterium zealandia]|nr:MAG: di-trans,poly-cis-decaprenylcistransferase [Candidatus Mycalebacterium zealandia]